jgi:hypothetical protein
MNKNDLLSDRAALRLIRQSLNRQKTIYYREGKDSPIKSANDKRDVGE